MPTNLPSIQMKNPSLFQPSYPCTGTVFADAALATRLLLENLQQLSACLSGFDRKTAPPFSPYSAVNLQHVFFNWDQVGRAGPALLPPSKTSVATGVCAAHMGPIVSRAPVSLPPSQRLLKPLLGAAAGRKRDEEDENKL